MPDLSLRRVKLTNGFGLHLRAAGLFVRLAQQFQSEVQIHCDGRVANGKSILDLMTLAAECGALLEIEISGPDAEDAITQLCALIEEGLHEDECGPDE
jgi:phosphotransferase system HPr (HPr) family protein